MWENRDIKPLAIAAGRNYLVPERNYYPKKFFPENLLAIELKKTHILTNKADYLGPSKLKVKTNQ